MSGAGPCLGCGSRETRLERGGDDHYRKRCDECDHVGGPFVSRHVDEAASERDGDQSSLADW